MKVKWLFPSIRLDLRISTGGGTHHLNLPLEGMFWDLEGMDDHNPQKMDGMGIIEYQARSQGGDAGGTCSRSL